MKIKNETIKKLTNLEMNNLGCMNIGINLVRGELKTRTGGWKRVQIDEKEFHFTNEMSDVRYEFIKLDSTSEFEGKELQDWAVRIFNEIHNWYEEFQSPLTALRFVK